MWLKGGTKKYIQIGTQKTVVLFIEKYCKYRAVWVYTNLLDIPVALYPLLALSGSFIRGIEWLIINGKITFSKMTLALLTRSLASICWQPPSWNVKSNILSASFLTALPSDFFILVEVKKNVLTLKYLFLKLKEQPYLDIQSPTTK